MTGSPAARGPRLALVTGGTRGLGKELTRELGRRGYHVIFTGRVAADGIEVARQLSSEIGVNIKWEELDVTCAVSLERLIMSIRANHGSLDVLVNNAGVCFEEWNPDTVRSSIDVNVIGPRRIVEAFLPLMSKGSCVINVSSGDGETVWFSDRWRVHMKETVNNVDGLFNFLENISSAADTTDPSSFIHGIQPAYKLSKLALNTYSQLIFPSLERQGVRVITVCPGDFCSQMNPTASTPPSDVVAPIVNLIDAEARSFPSGKFYRNEQLIEW